MDLEKIVETADKSDISSIKQTVLQILNIVNDPNSGARDLKAVIEVDPPLIAKLIKLSNSAIYPHTKPISEIQEAIVCIGFDSVKELALNQTVCELFKNDDYFHGYSRLLLWKHCLAVAICSKLIYRREFRERGDNIYVVGLLHDIGLIVLDQFNNEEFISVLKKSREDKNNLTAFEDDMLGYNHADIGMNLALTWDFPEEMVYAIGCHHTPDKAEEEFSKMSRTLYVANYVVQGKTIGYCDMPYPIRSVFNKCLMRLKLSQNALDLIIKETISELSKLEKSGFLA